MLTGIRIRIGVLAAHGVLALFVGLSLFYLRGVMTNFLFDAMAVIIAILLSAACLMLAAITDWVAAFSEGIKHIHWFIFYVFSGIILALPGFLLGYYPQATMQWLVVFAAIHAIAFSFSAFAVALKTKHHRLEHRAMLVFGTISALFSGWMVGLGRDMDDQTATSLLGAYLCFVGIKLLFFVWDLHRKTSFARHPRRSIANTASVN